MRVISSLTAETLCYQVELRPMELVSYILETQLSFTTTVITEQIGSIGNVSNLYSGGPSSQMRVRITGQEHNFIVPQQDMMASFFIVSDSSLTTYITILHHSWYMLHTYWLQRLKCSINK